MGAELKACRQCGITPKMETFRTGMKLYRCPKCGGRTVICLTERRARNDWNRRTDGR